MSQQWVFRKITDPNHRTRFLFIGNCGPGTGMTEAQVESLFKPLQPESVVVPTPASSFVFLVFGTEEQATQALQRLQEEGKQQGARRLCLRFSEGKLQASPVLQPLARPIAYTSEQLGVPGLQLLHDFITESEESEMLRALEAAGQAGAWRMLAKRRVQHYGWSFDYVARTLSHRLGPLPTWAQDVAARAAAVQGVDQTLDQLTVNEYTPGVGLAPHVDTHSAFTGAIVSLSLGSECIMELRLGDDIRPLLLPRRSLLVLSGESRYAWLHYIPSRKVDDLGPHPGAAPEPDQALQDANPGNADSGSSSSSGDGQQGPGCAATGGGEAPGRQQLVRGTRVSLTLRKVRGFPCDCAWPEQCDTRQGGPLPTRIAALAAQGLHMPSLYASFGRGGSVAEAHSLAGGPEGLGGGVAEAHSLAGGAEGRGGGVAEAEVSGGGAAGLHSLAGGADGHGGDVAGAKVQHGSPLTDGAQSHGDQGHGHANGSHANGSGAHEGHVHGGHALEAHVNAAEAHEGHVHGGHALEAHANGSETHVHGGHGLGDQMHGDQAHGHHAHAGLVHGEQVHANQGHGGEAHDAHGHGGEALEGQVHGGHAHGDEPQGDSTHGGQVHGVQAHEGQGHGVQTHGGQVHGVQAHGSHAHGVGGGDGGHALERAAEQLESTNVHAVYDAIAPHFSATRFAIWPKVREFITALPPGAVVMDVGCGNGKYFGVRSDISVLGSDRSAGLAEVAARRLSPALPATFVPRADVLQADGLQLPYREGSADGAICIAVLHHISSVQRRVRMLNELLRILRPGGRAIVTVWALEQEDPKKTLDKWTRIAPLAGRTLDQKEEEEDATLDRDNVPLAQANGGHTQQHDTREGPSSPTHHWSPSPTRQPPSPTHRPPSPTRRPSSPTRQPQDDPVLGSEGTDFMVPWHLPFHKTSVGAAAALAGAGGPVAAGAGRPAAAGPGRPPAPPAATGTAQQPANQPAGPAAATPAAAAAATPAAAAATPASAGAVGCTAGSAGAAGSTAASSGSGGGGGGYSHLGPAKAPAEASLCADKGAVVFQRYYHLFVAGELEGLVDGLPGCRRVEAFFDRSNWCVVFERIAP